MFRMKIVATMTDGSQKTLLTSSASDWKAAGSPTTFNNIYLGERYVRKQSPPQLGFHEHL